MLLECIEAGMGTKSSNNVTWSMRCYRSHVDIYIIACTFFINIYIFYCTSGHPLAGRGWILSWSIVELLYQKGMLVSLVSLSRPQKALLGRFIFSLLSWYTPLLLIWRRLR